MTDPLEAARQRVTDAKARFTIAVQALMADAPNAAVHADLALQALERAQAELARLNEQERTGGTAA